MQDVLFIVGSGRCGTKLIRSMLNLHSEIKLCRDAWFLPELIAQFGLSEITFEQYYYVIYEHYGSNGERWVENIAKNSGKNTENIKKEFLGRCSGIDKANVRVFTEKYFEYLFGEKSYILGDNTPHNGHIIKSIKMLWPKAKIIHLTRHGYFVAKSMIKHPGFIRWINSGLHPRELIRSHYKNNISKYNTDQLDIIDGLYFWEKSVNDIIDQTSDLKDKEFMEIKYEDLLQRPYKTLKDIFKFLNVDTINLKNYRGALLPKPFYLEINQNKKIETNFKDYEKIVEPTLSKLTFSNYNGYYKENYTSELIRSSLYHVSKQIIKLRNITR